MLWGIVLLISYSQCYSLRSIKIGSEMVNSDWIEFFTRTNFARACLDLSLWPHEQHPTKPTALASRYHNLELDCWSGERSHHRWLRRPLFEEARPPSSEERQFHNNSSRSHLTVSIHMLILIYWTVAEIKSGTHNITTITCFANWFNCGRWVLI